MDSSIDIVSVLTRKMPNSFFNSFQIKELEEGYNINLKVSAWDYMNLQDKSTGWCTSPSIVKNCFIEVVCLTDEGIFNTVTKENYLDILKKNNYETKIIKLENLNLEQLELKEPKISTDEEKIYKFIYEASFNVEKSNFIGFVTYCYYDSKEFGKQFNINIDDKKLNSSFMIEKFKLQKDKIINNLVTRMFTKENDVWLSEYYQSGDSFFYTVNNKKFPLTKKTQEIKVINLDLASIFKNLQIQNVKEIHNNISYENVSSIGECYNSIDKNGNLNIFFSFDKVSFIFNNSSIFLSLGKNSFENSAVIEWIKNLSIIKNIKVIRVNKKTKQEKIILNNTNIINSTNIGKLDNSFSDITLYNFYDDEFSYLNNGEFSYKLDITIDDGVLKYLQKLTNYAKEQNILIKKYLNECLNFSNKVDSSGNHTYYNFNEDLFTDNFINMQLMPNSTWFTCYDCSNSYIMLYNILESEKINITASELQTSLSPMNSSLTFLEKFVNLFDNLIKKADFILDKKTNTEFSKSYVLLNSIFPLNKACFYDYSTDFTSYQNLLLNNKIFFAFRQIEKIYRITSFYDDRKAIIESSDIKSEEENDFKISDATIQFLIEEMKRKFSEEQIGYTYLYNILSDHISDMLKLYNFKKNSNNALLAILKTKNIEELKSIYKNLTGSSDKLTNSTKNDFIEVTGIYSIIKYVQDNINYYFSFLNEKLDESMYKDYKKNIMFMLRYSKLAKIEYLSDYEDDTERNIKKIKKPLWKMLDINDQNFKDIMFNGKSVLMRFTPIKTSELGFFDDERLNFNMINRYFIMSN